MITINLSPSQYRVVQVTVECSSAVPVPNAVECSSTARASRMSQATAKLTAPTTKTATKTTTRPIYGIVNLALLAVSIYLLWANLI